MTVRFQIHFGSNKPKDFEYVWAHSLCSVTTVSKPWDRWMAPADASGNM